jgi:hypothetical protein
MIKKRAWHLFFLLGIILGVFYISGCGKDCKFNDITNTSFPDGTVGQAYSAQITYDITCSLTQKSAYKKSGTLPPGLNVTDKCEIAGTPTAAGTYTFEISMTICFGTSAFEMTDCHEKIKQFTIVIKE